MSPAPSLEPADLEIEGLSLERFRSLITPEQFRELEASGADARRVLGDRTIWNINSTARGGGVAEMLRSLTAYIRGAGLDARWLAIVPASPDFFRVTKRVHNQLHGAPGDGGPLGGEEARVYEEGLRPSGRALAGLLRKGDLVLLHDPQTAGLIEAACGAGALVVWRCHVGLDTPNDLARRAWRFLLPYVSAADATVFSREAFEWEGLDQSRMWVIPPSIDAFSPKNLDLGPAQVDAILAATSIFARDGSARANYERADGSLATVSRRTRMLEDEPLRTDARLVTQVSRWDRLKDPIGVVRGFAQHVAPYTDAHLVYAGPAVDAVADDPEGSQTLQETMEAWRALPLEQRRRVHLATLPMADLDENAVIVNALQHRSAVVVQKSLAEGFGLTVAEAMWKGRPVAASRIGGIQDQIDDGTTGILIDDPTDLAEFGTRVRGLLDDPQRAEAMGAAAREKVRDYFLAPRHLIQYADLMCALVAS